MPAVADGLLEFAKGHGGVDRSAARTLRHTLNNVATERLLSDLLARRRFDLVYERHAPFNAAGSIVCASNGLPHVLEVNAPLAWEGARHRNQALPQAASLLERAAIHHAAVVVTVSEELRDLLVADGADPDRVVVVPNGVDPDTFTATGRRRRPVDDDALVVGFVGSLKPWHGIDVLADAFREVAADERFHLLIVGDGPLAGCMRKLREELPGRVTLSGAVPAADVPAYLRAMDVCVAPYPATEPFYFSPLKVLEAMACGSAVVASRIGQLAHLIRDGRTGILVRPGDARAIARALLALADDEALLRGIGARAAMEVRRDHRWSQRVATLLELAAVPAVTVTS